MKPWSSGCSVALPLLLVLVWFASCWSGGALAGCNVTDGITTAGVRVEPCARGVQPSNATTPSSAASPGSAARQGFVSSFNEYTSHLVANAAITSAGNNSGGYAYASDSSDAYGSSSVADGHDPFAQPRMAPVANQGASVGSPGNCERTLAGLDSRLPRYNEPDLENVRSAILQEDLTVAMSRARAQGLSPAQAAAAAVQTADQAEQTMPQMAMCIRQTSTNPDLIIGELQNGSYRFHASMGIPDACAASYVLNYYQAVALREVAVSFACMATAAP
jgi:hypothetical protein